MFTFRNSWSCIEQATRSNALYLLTLCHPYCIRQRHNYKFYWASLSFCDRRHVCNRELRRFQSSFRLDRWLYSIGQISRFIRVFRVNANGHWKLTFKDSVKESHSQRDTTFSEKDRNPWTKRKRKRKGGRECELQGGEFGDKPTGEEWDRCCRTSTSGNIVMKIKFQDKCQDAVIMKEKFGREPYGTDSAMHTCNWSEAALYRLMIYLVVVTSQQTVWRCTEISTIVRLRLGLEPRPSSLTDQRTSEKLMGLVCFTSWYPSFNGSHFGLPPSEIPRMTGLPPKIVWTMTYPHRPH